ncbi:MAG: arylamine N-acetyltransferase [Candidatus Sericytochromatia bacterium]|nr:arylamine N-acetyltransferase [Candidatus Sericytochromatia bacterium]
MSNPSESDLDLPAYFARIGYAGTPAADPATLTALHRAHILAIPFENLTIQLGGTVPLDLASLQRKLVQDGRGGYCFEQNTLFQAILIRLGFRVTPLAARVSHGKPEPSSRSHMLLRVDLADGPYLVDVGFGGRGLWQPLPLRDGAADAWGNDSYRLQRADGHWTLQTLRSDGWTDLYTFTDEPQYPIDYEMANHFVATHPKSHFIQNLMAIRRTATGRTYVMNGDFATESATGTVKHPIEGPEALRALLATEFGIVLPAGPLSPRAWADTV